MSGDDGNSSTLPIAIAVVITTAVGVAECNNPTTGPDTTTQQQDTATDK